VPIHPGIVGAKVKGAVFALEWEEVHYETQWRRALVTNIEELSITFACRRSAD